MRKQFVVGPLLLHGQGALDALEEFVGRRVLVVTDRGIAGTPVLPLVLEHLRRSDVAVFDAVEPDPSIAVVARGLEVYLGHGPHAVVAVGGGSVIDAAKAMHLVAMKQDRHAQWGLVAIPTTSGSGSEVTSVAVVTDEVEQVKLPLIDARLMPRLAILDPKVVVGCPRTVTVDSGMDALTHAVEAYVATGASEVSDACAEKAVRTILVWLPKVLDDLSNLEARERMHDAANLAALAFENAGLGITHSLAHAIGGHFHVAHGRLNALLLPHVVEFNAEQPDVARRYAELAHAVGLDPMGHRSGVRRLVSAIRRLSSRVGIPGSILATGVDREAFMAAVPHLAEQALEDGCTPFNPVRPSAAALEGILRSLL